MKLGKTLYMIAIIGMVIIAAVMFYHNWIAPGFFVSLITLGGVVNYFDILKQTEISYSAEARKKRRDAYNALSKEQQEDILDNIEKAIAEDAMKLN
jgi:hypothetical protein